ncbi:DUF6327 family protein [Flavobacterium sp. '19STA2R22 D10 B1']|uniref:DUF6327 family protein n=1 Tax=Flavobacterium aerium TaxID=3037261 RepID=UPI00278C0177|nr:DUF6327 family protein [Flavobacterium sp. '19STA2R22 D10 B1']
MENQKYRSYSEIERDLEILKIEKEIYYQKLVLSVQETKDSLSPSHLLGNVPKAALGLLGGLSGPIKNVLISVILKKIFK